MLLNSFLNCYCFPKIDAFEGSWSLGIFLIFKIVIFIFKKINFINLWFKLCNKFFIKLFFKITWTKIFDKKQARESPRWRSINLLQLTKLLPPLQRKAYENQIFLMRNNVMRNKNNNFSLTLLNDNYYRMQLGKISANTFLFLKFLFPLFCLPLLFSYPMQDKFSASFINK